VNFARCQEARNHRLDPGGDYIRTNSLELTRSDSGTTRRPRLPGARAEANPRVTGWTPAFRLRTGNRPGNLARLTEPARNEVRQLNLRHLGISDFGEMKSRGFGRPTVPAHCELFYDHRPMTLARWPQRRGIPEDRELSGSQRSNDGHGGKIGRLEDGFQLREDRPRGWQGTGNVWCTGIGPGTGELL